jgi:hypothetical protein
VTTSATLPASSMDIFVTSLSNYQKDHDGERQTLKQKIIAFHKDEHGDWVADLECGHRQHVRHKPPWMVRPWIETPEGRESRIGVELECKPCDEMNTA